MRDAVLAGDAEDAGALEAAPEAVDAAALAGDAKDVLGHAGVDLDDGVAGGGQRGVEPDATLGQFDHRGEERRVGAVAGGGHRRDRLRA